MAVNHLVYQGRMVADPELRDTNSGVKVCNFRVAWSKKYGEREDKCFLDCKAFSKTAELVGARFVKGQEIVVEGELNTEEWEKDGQKRSKIVLKVTGVHFCGKRQEGAGAPPVDSQPVPEGTPVNIDGSELPF